MIYIKKVIIRIKRNNYYYLIKMFFIIIMQFIFVKKCNFIHAYVIFL